MNDRRHWLERFFFPRMTRRFVLRLLGLIVVSFLVFGYALIPLHLNGKSMEPTLRDGSMRFCWVPAYWMADPEVGDVVAVRFGGKRHFLAKRIVAQEGEVVSFVNGMLHIDGVPKTEPYVVLPCDWNLEPRVVDPGHYYVIGDNRSVSIEEHVFGQVSRGRITGRIIP